MSGEGREAVLAAIRDALGSRVGVAPVPRGYRTGAGVGGAGGDLVARFCARVAEYRATVHLTASDELEAAIASVLRGAGARRVAVPFGLPWRPPGVELLEDAPSLPARTLDGVDAVLTGCALAIAETGTFVLDGTGESGRRMLTLVPDHHVCVVRADQIVLGLPEAITALDPSRPLTFVSGPSATSDIELERVEGVHGPRVLDVIVVAAPPSATNKVPV